MGNQGSYPEDRNASAASASPAARPAPPAQDCRVCGGSGEDNHGQRCVCTYNKDRTSVGAERVHTPSPAPDNGLNQDQDEGLDHFGNTVFVGLEATVTPAGDEGGQ